MNVIWCDLWDFFKFQESVNVLKTRLRSLSSSSSDELQLGLMPENDGRVHLI